MTTAGESLSGREKALAYLRGTVLSDPALQGSFINEQRIATLVGVSRTPIREALLILASEGLVQMLPNRGAYVPPLSGREISELMDLRALLEKHAVTQAIELNHSPHTAMQTILDAQQAMATNHQDHPAAEFIELDRQFHQAMVDAAQSSLLSRTYAGLRERQIRVGIAAMQNGPDRWQQVCDEHTSIVDALRANKIKSAHAAIDTHLKITLQNLLTV